MKREKIKTIAIVAIVFFLSVFVYSNFAKGGILPPHEFAYGTALNSIRELPEKIEQFLSLEVLDPNKIQIETYVGFNSQKNLKPLINYISSQHNAALEPLIISLNEIDKISNQKEKVVNLVKTLIPYKDLLKDEPKQDFIIVFIYYGLKDPSSLPSAAKGHISDLVRQFDTSKQAKEFSGGKCPKDYLVGNVNIYPLALENTSWHKYTDFGISKKKNPIFEIRFMGLKGIFRYLIDEIKAKSGNSFKHLDGDKL